MIQCPETLRSAGVAAKVAPSRRLAWATYEPLSAHMAIVEVTYLGRDDLLSVLSAETGRNAPASRLYGRAYGIAEAAAAAHGYELDRFARA